VGKEFGQGYRDAKKGGGLTERGEKEKCGVQEGRQETTAKIFAFEARTPLTRLVKVHLGWGVLEVGKEVKKLWKVKREAE